jgi:hypothetical protein
VTSVIAGVTFVIAGVTFVIAGAMSVITRMTWSSRVFQLPN